MPEWYGGPGGLSPLMKEPNSPAKPTIEPLGSGLTIKAVTVNGKPWTEFNKDKETITLKGLSGNVAVTAQY